MRFLSIVLTVVLLSIIARADSNFELAQNKLKKSSGRIIRVIHGPDFLNIDNICSATLVGTSKIATASHCFYRNPDEIGKYPETLHFDIDGVTSENLNVAVSRLAGFDGNITGSNITIAKEILKFIPVIQDIKIHKKYAQSAKAAYQKTTPAAEHDVSISGLDRDIHSDFVKISTDYVDGETIYLAGQPGKHLSGKQKVITCQSGQQALDYLIVKLNTGERTSGKRKRAQSSEDTKPQRIANYKLYQSTAILNVCDESIVRGYSGGPQVVVRNNEVYLVGVTSQMSEPVFNIASDKIIGAKLAKLWISRKNR